MEEIIKNIKLIEAQIPKENPLKMIYTHVLLELSKINNILKVYGNRYHSIYLLPDHLEDSIDLYIKRLKKIREHYHLTTDSPLPRDLRGPVLTRGDVIKLSYEDKKDTIHITYDNCRAKHIEIDKRLVIIFTSVDVNNIRS